jgi:hypothetical protein
MSWCMATLLVVQYPRHRQQLLRMGFGEPGSAEGPDRDPKPLVSAPILPLLLFGLDWHPATEVPAKQERQAVKGRCLDCLR